MADREAGTSGLRFHDVAGLRIAAPERIIEPIDRPTGERRLAYWARLWPGGVVLARLVTDELAPALRGRRVIELGCGLAAPGLAAARAGAHVMLTDGETDPLLLAAENARANGVEVTVARIEWDLVPEALAGRFDVVLGAEIVYDREKVAPLAGAIATLLVPGGAAWLLDPARLGRDTIVDAARAAGLDAEVVRTLPHPADVEPADGGFPHDLYLYRFGRRR